MALGEPHQSALVADEALVDVVELLDQGVDARLIEPQRLHLDDDLFLELLVLALLRRRQQLVVQLVVDVLVLQSAQAFEGIGDGVEGLQHLGLELGLDRGERHRVLGIVLVGVAFAECAFLRLLFAAPTFSGLGLNGVGAGGADGGATGCGGTTRRNGGALAGAVDGASTPGTAAGTALASGPAYVASRSIMSCRNTLPSFNSLRQMVTAWKVSGLSHRPAIIASRPASIRLAMATSPWRESSPIEPISRRYMRTGSSVRSIGSLASDLAGVFGVTSTSSLDSVSSLSRLLARLLLVGLGLLGLDHVDAHLVERRQNVLNLLGSDLFRGHDRIELLVGDVAALRGLSISFVTAASERSRSGSRASGISGPFSRASSFCGVALVLFAISLSTPGASLAPGHGLSRMPPTAGVASDGRFLSLVHPA